MVDENYLKEQAYMRAEQGMELGKGAIGWWFESPIKVGRYAISGGQTPKPDMMDVLMTSLTLVPASKLIKFAKILRKRPVLGLPLRHPFKSTALTLPAIGYYAAKTGKMTEAHPGAEVYFKPSGLASMGIFGSIEAGEMFGYPVKAMLNVGNIAMARKAQARIKIQKKELVEFVTNLKKITPLARVNVQMFIENMEHNIRRNDWLIETEQLRMDYIVPFEEMISDEVGKEEIAVRANRKELDLLSGQRTENARQISKLKILRLRTPAKIGDITVMTELDAMMAVSVGRFKVMQAQLDKLTSSDVYGTFRQKEQDYITTARTKQVEISHMQSTAVVGTAFYSRDMPILVAESKLWNEQAILCLEREYREAEAADITTQRLDEVMKAQQILNLDYQLAYTKKHDDLNFFVMDVEDSNTAQYKTLASVKSGLNKVWNEQSLLKSSAETFKTNIEKNEDKISGYKKTLQLLREKEIETARIKMEELNGNIEDMFAFRP